MAAIAHHLGAPLANNPHWSPAREAGQGQAPFSLTKNRLDPDLNLVEISVYES